MNICENTYDWDVDGELMVELTYCLNRIIISIKLLQTVNKQLRF